MVGRQELFEGVGGWGGEGGRVHMKHESSLKLVFLTSFNYVYLPTPHKRSYFCKCVFRTAFYTHGETPSTHSCTWRGGAQGCAYCSNIQGAASMCTRCVLQSGA